MLTRETALASLRQHGTLASSPNAANVITKSQAGGQLAHKIIDLIHGNRGRSRTRLLAPALSQAVLP